MPSALQEKEAGQTTALNSAFQRLFIVSFNTFLSNMFHEYASQGCLYSPSLPPDGATTSDRCAVNGDIRSVIRSGGGLHSLKAGGSLSPSASEPLTLTSSNCSLRGPARVFDKTKHLDLCRAVTLPRWVRGLPGWRGLDGGGEDWM